MRFFQITLFILLAAVYCSAIPADDGTFPLKQPDGSAIEVRYVGDEWFHVLQTEDGYFLKEDILGFYSYINEKGESSGIYARNADERSDSEVEFLKGLNQNDIYNLLMKNNPPVEAMDYRVPDFVYRKVMRMPSYNSKITQGDVRGMVVLVQFQDVKFKDADPQKQFTDYMNKEGYNEYYNRGSIRDYFIENSMGKFRPTFDVYGPITISGPRNTYGTKSENDRYYNGARLALIEALDSLYKRGGIDFSQYDNDNNKEIDFIYMFYAGVGANNSDVVGAIWPHAWVVGNKEMGKNIYADRYACSNEIDGHAYSSDHSTSILGGIGTFVHEFSHVLGLPDMYDLSDTTNRLTPKKWDVMDRGNYNCPQNPKNTQNCAPPYYSAFERMSLGWMSPTELYAKGAVRLDKIDDNKAYSITNPNNPDEMFLLEYRTNKNWDIGQPGSGMLIWHIDYKDSIWNEKSINNNGDHMYVDIEEAVPEIDQYASARDAFPGSGRVTSFNKFVFWNGDSMEIALSQIKESSDKEYITFNVNMSVSSSESSSSAEQSSSSATASIVAYKNGLLQVPAQGPKTIRIFSLHGKLLYETITDDQEYRVPWPQQLGNSKGILSVSQNGKTLFTGILAPSRR